MQIFCSQNLQNILGLLEDELRFVVITSSADVIDTNAKSELIPEHELSSGEKLVVTVKKSEHPKCVRCWHHRADVGKNSDHPELCMRCVSNVEGSGEIRMYA